LLPSSAVEEAAEPDEADAAAHVTLHVASCDALTGANKSPTMGTAAAAAAANDDGGGGGNGNDENKDELWISSDTMMAFKTVWS